jgi:hypothetical protein
MRRSYSKFNELLINGMEQINDIRLMEFLPLQLRQDVRKWHTANPNAYKKFYRLFKRMSEFDITLVKKLYAFIVDCIPQELVDVFEYKVNILVERETDNIQEPYIVEKYKSYVEKSYEGTYTIVIDVVSDEVHCVSNRRLKDVVTNNSIIVNNYVYEAMITHVSKRHRAFLNNLLREMIDSVETDIENKRSEIEEKYRSQAKMIAYDLLAYIAICTPKFIRNCRNKSTRYHNLFFCLLYFLFFDNGFPKYAQVLIDLINMADSLGPEYHFLKEQAIKSMVNVSVSKGYEKKESWKEMAKKQEEIDDEDAINSALSHIKGKKGRKPENRILEELLNGTDISGLLRMIESFIREEKVLTVDLGTLFYILSKTEHVKKNIGYETFHKALQAYTKNQFKGHTEPQEWFVELNSDYKYLDKEYALKCNDHISRRWEKGRCLCKKWIPRFSSI